MAASQSLLQLAASAGLSPSMRGAVQAQIVVDELTPFLPVQTLAGTRAYGYDRVTGYVTANWVNPDAALSSSGGRKIGRIMAETKKLYAQPDISPEDAARLGGGDSTLAELAASCFTAMSRKIGDAAINGSSAPSAVIDASSTLVASTCVTAVTCGGMLDLSLSAEGSIRFTATGDYFQYRAPGDLAFGDQVAIAASSTNTVYSANGDAWLRITRGVGSIAADTTAVVTITAGAAQPDGIYSLMAQNSSQWIYAGTNGGALTFELLDQLFDLCKGDGQKVMLMSKRTRRSLVKLLRDKATQESFEAVGGKKVPTYGGVPVIVSDYMPNTRTRGSSGAVCSSIILMTVGDGQGFGGVASTGIVDTAMQGARLIASGPFGTAAYQIPVSATSDALVERATGYFGFKQELREGIAILDGLTYSG